ncbi:MAG: hypothetical protein ACREVX_11170 [Clostridium sp.]|uniref:hypothetical protein n=1 Tax=Clostridium sp. TaxID=1506 RepID=UPI003D6C8128
MFISFAVTYGVLSLFYLINIGGIDTTLNSYSDIIKWFFMDMFQYICIFTFIMLIQSVMGNSIVSSIVGGIILLVPLFIIMISENLFYRYYGFIEYISAVFDKFYRWLNIYSYNSPHQNYIKIATDQGYSGVRQPFMNEWLPYPLMGT